MNISYKDGLNKGEKWYGLIEAEDIKKRWQEYTEVYKKDLHHPDNHDGVITRARCPRMRSQVGLRKHHYEQS